jgi:tetratricopeptide (TPR) repeat protein
MADLDEAERRGASPTRTNLLRAVWRDRTERAAADRDLNAGLERPPADERDYLTRGMAWLRQQKPQKALADFDRALEINPQSRMAWMNRAHVLAEHLDRQEDAAAALDRVLELYPQHAPALAGQAVVLARLGRRDRAHARIAEALLQDTGGEVRYQAGCVYALTSKQVPADADVALMHLVQAIRAQYGLAFIDRDEDLAPLRERAGFRKLVEGVRALNEALRRQ